jgi:SAM-dependent methyltransferase
MAAVYGIHYPGRYEAVAGLIAPGTSVLDLCCGPGILYGRHLRRKAVRYTGWDVDPRFIARVRRAGGDGRVCDVRGGREFPAADYVVMQGSLYHFLPHAGSVVERMLRAARRYVIVAEPIRNWTTSRCRVLAWLARELTAVGGEAAALRFTEPALDALFARYRDRVAQSRLIPGGREKVYVLRGAEGDAAGTRFFSRTSTGGVGR